MSEPLGNPVVNPIINVDELEFSDSASHGQRFEVRMAEVAPKIGAKRLGYNVTAVPPGKRAFPFHNHHANEEMFFVLAGEGTLRFGAGEYPVRAGDIIACPPGGPEVAHQLINSGTEELRYLAVSTNIGTDVFQYPDSGKFGVSAGRGPDRDEARFRGFYDQSTSLGYWDGEEP
ncbi:cupin domain-containing protein [Haliangium sp.]|uniref:cupin domain-containing protein n=1 Tax=Haliangium sp. TaxID=2663208 RepID=UPI003D0AF3E1